MVVANNRKPFEVSKRNKEEKYIAREKYGFFSKDLEFEFEPHQTDFLTPSIIEHMNDEIMRKTVSALRCLGVTTDVPFLKKNWMPPSLNGDCAQNVTLFTEQDADLLTYLVGKGICNLVVENSTSKFLPEQPLSLDEALAEIAELNPYQCESLLELCHLGLRGDHLRNWQPCLEEKERLYGPKERDMLRDLIKVDSIPPAVAVQCISGLSSQELPKKPIIFFGKQFVAERGALFRKNMTLNYGEGIFTADDMAEMNFEQLCQVQKPACLNALQNKLFTMKDIVRMDGEVLEVLIKPACIDALHEGLFSIDDVAGINNHLLAQLKNFWPGVKLNNDVLDGKRHLLVLASRNILEEIIRPACLYALRKKIFTIKDIVNAVYEDNIQGGKALAWVTYSSCLEAMSEGLVTFAEAAKLQKIKPGSVFRDIFKPECLNAIRERRTTIGQLTTMPVDELRTALKTGNYPCFQSPTRIGINKRWE